MIPVSMLPEFLTVGGNDTGPPVLYSCAQCGAGMDADAARASLFCGPCKAKPPTLREWLGDRVSELGPWADVLREQPVPAGHLRAWEWKPHGGGAWYATPLHYMVLPDTVLGAARGRIGLLQHSEQSAQSLTEALQMALFTRHPDVKPEPRPAAIVCEDQYEVLP